MDVFLAALEQSAFASFLRTARWEYAAVNAAHIFGIALLVGGIVPLDLKLMGLWPSIERRVLARVLVPVAATGALLAVITGAMLFSIRAQDYASLGVLRLKLAIITFGLTAAVIAHIRFGLWLDRAPQASLAHVGIISLICWISALTSGRLIAFVM